MSSYTLSWVAPGRTLLLLSFLLLSSGLQAQPEAYNWRFGIRSGLTFGPAGPPTVVQLPFGLQPFNPPEACAVASDSVGNLLFYTNGDRVWNRQNALMPGDLFSGQSRGSSTQGALVLRHPGGGRRYYVFSVDQNENSQREGLRYSMVDMGLNGGLGGLLGSPRNIMVPFPAGSASLTEKLTAVRHPNGHDYWVLVHGWNNDAYYAYLLTAGGLAATPVVSHIGRVHSGGGGPLNNLSSAGYLRASPSGRWLAAAIAMKGVDVSEFDPLTGRVSNVTALALPPGTEYYGVEFSSDESQLYLTTLDEGLLQAALPAGAGNAVTTILARPGLGALLRGPDDKIYCAISSQGIGVVQQPNLAGPGCQFQPNAISVAPFGMQLGLPNFPNGFSAALRVRGPQRACVGQVLTFRGDVAFGLAGGSLTWDFGNPAAGAANTAAGPGAQHAYQQPGTYQLRLTARAGSRVVTTTVAVVVEAPPVARISPGQPMLCPGEQVILSAPVLAGATYRWQDGSTAANLAARSPGRYAVSVTVAGCKSVDSVLVTACSWLIPNVITPNADGENDVFVLRGLQAVQWRCRIFNRWGRLVSESASYQSDWNAAGQPAGVYYYELTHRQTGQRLKGTVEVLR